MILAHNGPITGDYMRPRFQQGQITKRGPNWVLRYHEDRNIDGVVKRVRTIKVLGSYSQHPLKETQTTQVRALFNDKINAILATVNTQSSNPADGTLTVGEFIEQRYFPRLDQRLQMPAGNELHIEPSTVKGYQDIWKIHVRNNPVA